MAKFIDTPFCKKVSPKVLELDDEYMNYAKAVESSEQAPFLTEHIFTKLINSGQELINKVEKAKPDTHFEKILLTNIKERTRSLVEDLKIKKNSEPRLSEVVKAYLLEDKHIKKAFDVFKKIDVDEINETYFKLGPITATTAETEEELSSAFKFVKDFLKSIHKDSGIQISYDTLKKSLEFARNSASYHYTGKIVFGSKNAYYISYFDFTDMRVKRFLDVLSCAEVLGHESLFGHQGHFIVTTKHTNLTSLTYTDKSEKLQAEMIAEAGSSRAIELLKREGLDKYYPPYLAPKALSFHDISVKAGILNSFVHNYTEYLHTKGETSVEESLDLLYRLLKRPYFKSKVALKKFEYYFNYYLNYDNRFDTARRFTSAIARALSDSLLKFFRHDEAKKWVLFGYFTPKAFEMYLKLLEEEFL